MEKPQIDEAKINGSNNTCISIDLRLIDLLMKREYKCDVNKRDIIGANPIYYCIMNENMDAVKKLINYGSFVKSITKTSFFMNQIVTRDEEIIVEAQVHLVFVNKEGKPVKIPEEIYSKFKPYFCDTIKV